MQVYMLSFGFSQGFPGGPAGKESSCNVGDLGAMPGLGRSPGEGKGYPFQYSGLENPRTEEPGFDSWVGKIPWRRERLPLQDSGLENSVDCIVHGVTKSWT